MAGFEPDRFVEAQAVAWPAALAELRSGRSNQMVASRPSPKASVPLFIRP